jgi:hypothetical protein
LKGAGGTIWTQPAPDGDEYEQAHVIDIDLGESSSQHDLRALSEFLSRLEKPSANLFSLDLDSYELPWGSRRALCRSADCSGGSLKSVPPL